MAPPSLLPPQVLEDAGSQCGVRVVCIYGGVPKREQVEALKRGVEVVVGTPDPTATAVATSCSRRIGEAGCSNDNHR